jgi:hypothetical protein
MSVTPLDLSQVEAWLASRGVHDIAAILDGIDQKEPMYLRWFHPGEKLVQYRDRPSVPFPEGALTGRWYGLPSHPADEIGTLGIGSGLAGRRRVELTVAAPFQALETTAASMDRSGKMLYDRVVGRGGATQVFIPDSLRAAFV